MPTGIELVEKSKLGIRLASRQATGDVILTQLLHGWRNIFMSSNEAFKALADLTRREILGLIRQGEMTAGALAERFDMTKPSMSHHFAILKEADLITIRREGQQIWYALNTTVVQDLMAWAMDLIRDETKKGPKRR